MLCFFWHRPKYIAIIAPTTAATVVLELLVHGVVHIQADIQYKHKHEHESHMKAQTSRQQADIQDTRRQHQTHECIGTRQTHKTQDTGTSTIMSHT